MNLSSAFFNSTILAWMILSLPTFLVLLFISAPYGRFYSRKWGPPLPARLAWLIMELPSVFLMFILFLTGKNATDPIALAFLIIWKIHYFQRTFIYPALIKPGSSPMCLSMLFSGITFNLVNIFFNGYWLFHLAPPYGSAWFLDMRFIGGVLLFACGMIINQHSDYILRSLRPVGGKDYKIPQGGLYRWVSSPNYLGEILEWGGWALATWSLAGLSFFIWTVANLLPRALSNHKWYKQKFPNYPSRRRALVPYIL